MKTRGFLIVLLFNIALLPACDNGNNRIQMHFDETGCANPWQRLQDDTDYLDEVKSYLEQHKIKIIDIWLSHDGYTTGCLACSCTTGRRINILIHERDLDRVLEIGFYGD